VPLSDNLELRRLLTETTVLYVDADGAARQDAGGLLAGRVQELFFAEDGQQGMFTYALRRPDVIVAAAAMPGLDGLALAQAVRAIDPDVPFVLVADLDDARMLHDAVAMGVTGFVGRPLRADQLAEAVARAASGLHLRRAIARQERLSRVMLDAAPSPAILVDIEGATIIASNQLAAALGYLTGAPAEGPLIPANLLAQLRRGGGGLLAEASSHEVAAHERHWLLHWAPADQNLLLFTALDITSRVEMEVFRADVERIARHDLKTPLTAFTSVPDLLLESDNLTDEQRQFIQLIRDAGTRMLAMINLSLDLYKMETGNYAPPAARFGLRGLLARALSGTRELAQSLEVALRLQEDAPAAQGEMHVRGDALLCHSMFDNLLKNALEAAAGGGDVSVTLRQGPPFAVVIENAGEVPRDILPRFFDKYSTSGKRSGTGLGTYSARMVARAHGGDVLLDAAPPGRTRLTVLLPPAF
jgi:signal transduction histidine kinase